MDSRDILAFQLIDAGNTTRTPPNQQTITVSNLLAQIALSLERQQ